MCNHVGCTCEEEMTAVILRWTVNGLIGHMKLFAVLLSAAEAFEVHATELAGDVGWRITGFAILISPKLGHHAYFVLRQVIIAVAIHVAFLAVVVVRIRELVPLHVFLAIEGLLACRICAFD